MKLISLIEFVLKLNDFAIEAYDLSDHQNTKETAFRKIVEYAKFLNLKLELWMFVPCDKDNNPIPEPYLGDFYYEYERGFTCPQDSANYQEALGKYEDAKKQCFFEGFDYCKQKDPIDGDYYLVRNAFIKIYDIEFEKISIEDLRKRLFVDLELTEAAKQLLNYEKN